MYNKEYYEKNKEVYKNSYKKYYENNKEKIKKQKKKYYSNKKLEQFLDQKVMTINWSKLI